VIGVRRPSVCLSDVTYIGSNSKTKRPRKTKLLRSTPGHMRLPHRLQGQKVKGQGHGAGAYCGGRLAAQLVIYIVNFFGYVFSLPFSELSLVGLAHRLSVL